jgi:hypothetical protein
MKPSVATVSARYAPDVWASSQSARRAMCRMTSIARNSPVFYCLRQNSCRVEWALSRIISIIGNLSNPLVDAVIQPLAVLDK